jgi:hypothetical protein
MTGEELCRKYEHKINKFRLRPMMEDEIIVRTWASICERLQAKSFDKGIDVKTAKSLRSASRQIRGCLLTGKKTAPSTKDIEILKRASALCYAEANAHLEAMTVDVDAMARLIVAGHVLKRRLNACRERLIHAIMVIADNIECLKEKGNEE